MMDTNELLKAMSGLPIDIYSDYYFYKYSDKSSAVNMPFPTYKEMFICVGEMISIPDLSKKHMVMDVGMAILSFTDKDQLHLDALSDNYRKMVYGTTKLL